MEVHFGPNSIDEPNLLYKLQCKIKVFSTSNTLAHRGYNLVASSCKYGLVFVGVPDGTLSVYQLHQLIGNESEPLHMTVHLPEKPTHISVNCDSELLAVTGKKILCIYNVADFQNPKVAPILSFKYDLSPPSYVSAMQWNPCVPDFIALAFHNGCLITCQVANGQVKKVNSKARCLCWSPKGKQLVVGNNDGTLHQFKPDLTQTKAFPAPNLFEGAPVEALAVYWISTYQFAVVYKNAAENSRPSVTIFNTPKGGQPTCFNYEDICFSQGTNRPWYYYLHGIPQWNIIIAASSNSMEMTTMGSADGANWAQWCQPDEARPELPLIDKKKENYPIGVCLDFCAIHQLPWGENEKLPYMPLMHVLSDAGLLTIFNVINLNNQAPQICCPPQLLALPAEAMDSAIPGLAPGQADAPEPPPQTKDQTASSTFVPPASVFNQPPPPPPTSCAERVKLPSYNQPAPTEVKLAPENREAFPALMEKGEAPPPQPKPTLPVEPQTPSPGDAALKAEQERINKAKANQELKNILVKEVNDFQNEMYNFMLKTRETQARIQRDIESMNSNFSFNSIDTEQLKKECSVDELRNAIVQLKLELVRACAVIAEARTHSDAREFHKWSQADPLTTKRVASIEKLAYYVHTQLDQAQEALDYKWSKASQDHECNQPGKRMIRPILDDVYQPLVKQQEILSRQQAVLRTLRKTLSECDAGPVFKSTSLLRSTPFRNKDPLSKLTKNILNMTIEPQNSKPAKGLLTAQKIEALKDALSNRKTVKIKPVNVEYRQNFVTMKENYDKMMRENMAKAQAMADMEKQSTADYEPLTPEYQKEAPLYQPMPEESTEEKYSAPRENVDANVESETKPVEETVKQEEKHSSLAPTPPPAANVVRTLFTDEPEPQEPTRPQTQSQMKSFSFNQQPSTMTTSSELRDLLQNQSQAHLADLNKEKCVNDLYSGQLHGVSISISRSSKPTMPPNEVPTSTPMADMSNIFNKLPAQAHSAASKPTSATNSVPALTENPKPTSTANPIPSNVHGETGEPDLTAPTDSKPTKPITTNFGMKPPATSTPLPDVSKNSFNLKVNLKLNVDRTAKSKENVAKADDAKEQKIEMNPLGTLTTNKAFAFGQAANKSSPFAAVKASDVKSENQSLFENNGTAKTSEPKIPPASAAPKQSVFHTTLSSKPKESTLPKGPTVLKESTPKEPTVLKEPTLPKESTDLKEPTLPKESTLPEESKPQKESKPPKEPTPPKETHRESPPKDSTPPKSEPEQPAESSPASSIFEAAVASQPKTEGLFASQGAPIFASTNSSTGTLFGPNSVFGSSSKAFAETFAAQAPTAASGFTSGSEPADFGSDTASDVSSTASVPTKTDTESVPTTPVSSSAPSSVFSETTAPFGTNVTSSSSVLTATPSSVFGQATGAFAPTTTSLFVTTTASTFGGSLFGTTTQASVFEPSSTPSSVFGTAATQAFGNKTPTTQPGSIFGASTTQASIFSTAASTQSIFGTTQASVFGASTTQVSIFGTTTKTTQASVFGTPTVTTQSSIFGTPTQTTQVSVFGTPTQTTQASAFGTPTQTTQAPIFGTPTQTTQASVFGTPTQTTQASVFGTPTQTTQASVFGTPTPTTQASIFGTPTPTTQASIFGTPTQTTQASVFGAAQSASVFGSANSGSLFGGGEANLFAAASISPGSAPSGAGGNIFGGSSTGSVFGGAGNMFGKSAFGQSNNNTAGNIFSGANAFGQQKPANSLWGGGSNAGGFGSSGFGQQTPQASMFGDASAGSFSAPSGGAFGTPAFGTGDSQPSSVFGTPQQAPGFGGSATFGSKPAFGQPAGFGSPTSAGGGGFGGFGGGFNKSPSGFGAPAAFGSAATFGGTAFGNTSPGRVFGGGAATGFGSPTQQSNTTFENLATQNNTLTFGSLAKTPQQQPQQPSFNTSPSFSGWRG